MDQEGRFSDLGFGSEEINVATWSDWDEPTKHDQVDPSPVSDHLNTFVSTWCDVNKRGFDDFVFDVVIYK